VADSFCYLPCEDTGYFSRLVTDYLKDSADVQPFYRYSRDINGIDKAIDDRMAHPVDRQVLVDTLRKQYAHLELHGHTQQNIDSLLSENTFTICTAHQPNLLTGYLYFIYKILHAIKMADHLNGAYPGKHFVPVYYMGSEDNDLEELGVFRFRGNKYVWDGDGQKGAVGRMSTASLKKMMGDLFKMFGPPGKDCEQLQTIVTNAYLKHKTIGAATQYLVNELFGKYGLVVLDPDDAALKAQYIPVMEDELLNQTAFPILTDQINRLAAHYKIQAHPREINLFYLADQLRERIEKHGDKWIVVNTAIEWTKEEVLKELHEHPERFSPNVMLRGLFQEMILPDVAFIGGGAEVAYWMQLKDTFDHYKGFFPVVYLRQSVMWVSKYAGDLYKELELSMQDVFKDEEALITEYVKRHTDNSWQTTGEDSIIDQTLHQLKEKAVKVDSTLGSSAEAALAKIKKQLAILEQKMLRAEKRKMEVQLARIHRMKTALFPNGGLQERVDNFAEYYLDHGPAFMDIVLEGIEPLTGQFLVVEHG